MFITDVSKSDSHLDLCNIFSLTRRDKTAQSKQFRRQEQKYKKGDVWESQQLINRVDDHHGIYRVE